MSWIGRRLDHLGAAALGAAGGLTLSQAPAFTHAYLQRLGGHIDEATHTIQRMQNAELLPWLAGDGREQAVGELTERLDALRAMQQQLLDAPALLRPLTLLRQGDWSIMRATAEVFVPAIPIDPASLVWTLIGVILASICWDGLKIPFWARARIAQRRQARSEPKPAQKSTARTDA